MIVTNQVFTNMTLWEMFGIISYQGYTHLTLNPTNIDLKIPCTVKKRVGVLYDNDNSFQPRSLALRILLFECSTKYKHNTWCSSRSLPLLSFTVNVLIYKRIHDKGALLRKWKKNLRKCIQASVIPFGSSGRYSVLSIQQQFAVGHFAHRNILSVFNNPNHIQLLNNMVTFSYRHIL